MKEKALEIAARELKTEAALIENNYLELPEIDAHCFWISGRGGLSIIVNNNGETLRMTSRYSLQQHIEAFKEGNRN